MDKMWEIRSTSLTHSKNRLNNKWIIPSGYNRSVEKLMSYPFRVMYNKRYLN